MRIKNTVLFAAVLAIGSVASLPRLCTEGSDGSVAAESGDSFSCAARYNALLGQAKAALVKGDRGAAINSLIAAKIQLRTCHQIGRAKLDCCSRWRAELHTMGPDRAGRRLYQRLTGSKVWSISEGSTFCPLLSRPIKLLICSLFFRKTGLVPFLVPPCLPSWAASRDAS